MKLKQACYAFLVMGAVATFTSCSEEEMAKPDTAQNALGVDDSTPAYEIISGDESIPNIGAAARDAAQPVIFQINRLNRGSFVVSGGSRLVMQGDGNLVVYNPQGRPTWSTRTGGSEGQFVVMQGDGNFVLYTGMGQALWASGTRAPGARMLYQNGVLFIQFNGRIIWTNLTGSINI